MRFASPSYPSGAPVAKSHGRAALRDCGPFGERSRVARAAATTEDTMDDRHIYETDIMVSSLLLIAMAGATFALVLWLALLPVL